MTALLIILRDIRYYYKWYSIFTSWSSMEIKMVTKFLYTRMFLFISINWRRIFLALRLAYRHIHEYVSNSHENKKIQGHDIPSQFKLIDVGYHTLKERENVFWGIWCFRGEHEMVGNIFKMIFGWNIFELKLTILICYSNMTPCGFYIHSLPLGYAPGKGFEVSLF